MKLYFTCFSNRSYQDLRKQLCEKAKSVFDGIFEYDYDDFLTKTAFYQQNIKILSEQRGCGYWLWKPYIILKALNEINNGDAVLYMDCGNSFKDKLVDFLKIHFRKNDTFLLDGGFVNKCWTKYDCFYGMDCDEDKYKNAIQLLGAACGFKKTDATIKFAEEWLHYCQDEDLLTDSLNKHSQNDSCFVEHRHDQSILTNLKVKYNLPSYPSNHKIRELITCHINRAAIKLQFPRIQEKCMSGLPMSQIHNFNQNDRNAWVSEKAASVPKGAKVLDVGAGTCLYRNLFSHCDYKTHDFGEYKGVKLGGTTEYGKIDYLSDIINIPVADNSFDVILCTEVLEHVPEPIEALREMARILRPGGRMLLTAPLGSGLHQLPYHYYGGYTPEWYKHFARKFGLEVKEITPNGGFFKLLSQECVRASTLLPPHRTGDNIEVARSLLGDWLPRYLFALEESQFIDQFTVGYHVEFMKKAEIKTKSKLAVLCLPGLESFLGEITDHLSAKYEVKTCYGNDRSDMAKLIRWADIVWLEWANELTIALTNQPGLLDGKHVICRLHSYEALAGYAQKVNWDKVSDVIFVAEHIKDIVLEQVPDLPSNIHVIPNGINLDKFRFKKRKRGVNLAFVGDINYKKGPMLLLHAFQALVALDSTYQLYMIGSFQDMRYSLYFKQMITAMGLSKNIHLEGRIPHDKVPEWLEDKNYIVCTSVLEGHPVGLMEAMACGLMPIIHNFVGAEGIYPSKYLWNTIGDFIHSVVYEKYDSSRYRKFVQNNYSLETQLNGIDSVLDNLEAPNISAKPEGEVTAVIAVRNGASTIAMALDSLLAQIVPLKRIIVVDDFSSDDTPEIVEKYVANFDGKVELIKLPHNHWVYKARNIGFKEVGTEFFFFLDADDFVGPEYTQKLLTVLNNNPDCAFAYPDMIHFDGRNRKHVPLPDFDVPLLVQRNYIPYSALMRANAFMSVGGYDNYLNDSRNHMTEWDLWLKFIANEKNGVHCPESLFCYRQHKDQMNRNYERSRNDMKVQVVFNAEGSVPRVCGSGKRGMLVCKGMDYLDNSKMSGEVYTWLKPLEEFGEVTTFFYDIEIKHFGREGMIKRLCALIDQVQPEYIFHSAYKEEIPIETWEGISKKFTTIAWFSDDNWRFESYSKRYCKGFRYAVTTYPMMCEDYKEMGYENILLSQWAANPAYFKNHDFAKDIKVSFCGQNYGDRNKLLEKLNVECFGKGWPNGMLDFEDMAKVLNRSKISINFSKGANGEPQIKMRPFEIAASNTMPLCEYVEGIEKYYKIGKEIVVFRNEKELKEKIDYYLTHHTEREEIAKAAYDRTMKEHTWRNRFESIFKTIGVNT